MIAPKSWYFILRTIPHPTPPHPTPPPKSVFTAPVHPRKSVGVDFFFSTARGEPHLSSVTSQISVGLYHTAGKGTRLAPMPGSENNNKPGVKIAVTVDINGKPSPLTILESVIKQTGVYGKSRKGRLSVFWGDQVYIYICIIGGGKGE